MKYIHIKVLMIVYNNQNVQELLILIIKVLDIMIIY